MPTEPEVADAGSVAAQSSTRLEQREQGGRTMESQADKKRKSAQDFSSTTAETSISFILTNSNDPCLLLEYATLECVPNHVQQLFSHYEHRKLTQAETVLLLIYAVALECGYADEKVYKKVCEQLAPVPVSSSFHAQNVRLLTLDPADYSLEFDDSVFRLQLRTILDLYCDTENCSVNNKEDAISKRVANADDVTHLLQSRLMAIISGDLLIVTLSPAPPATERGFSICLPMGRYVLNVHAKDKPIYHRFRQLKELSVLLREQLFIPMRSQQLRALNINIYPALMGLPAELYDDIFQHLSQNQLNIVANVNKHLNYFIKHSKYHRKNSSLTEVD